MARLLYNTTDATYGDSGNKYLGGIDPGTLSVDLWAVSYFDTRITTITAKANIKSIVNCVVSAKGRIQNTGGKIISAKASIKDTNENTLTAVGRIEILSTTNISAKANIRTFINASIISKANIRNFVPTSISVKANIRNAVPATVAAKAELMITSDVISGVAHVAMANGAQNKIVKDSNGILYVAGIRKNTSNKNGVFIARSADSGLTWLWNWETAISDEVTDYLSCSIAIDSNNDLHVVAHDSARIRYRKYDLSEGTWDAIFDVQETALTTGNQNTPSIAIDSTNQIYIVWHGFTTANTGKTNIRFRKTIANAWQTVTEITAQNTYNNKNAKVAININGYIELVWESNDGNVYTREFTTSWQTAESLTTGDAVDTQAIPDISCDGNGKSVVTWYGKKVIGDTYVKIRATYGSRGAWSAITDLTDGSAVVTSPVVTCDNNNNYTVFWSEVVGAYTQIKHKSFGGAAWEQVYTLTTTSINKYYPSVFKQLFPASLRPSARRLVTFVSGNASDYQFMGDYYLVTEMVTTKANIRASLNKTILAKAAIKQGGVGVIISAKARIQKTVTYLATSKASIGLTAVRLITAKGRVNIIGVTTIIQAKASIKKTQDIIIQAIGNIFNISQDSVQAKASIKIFNVETNISALASITYTNSSDINSKGRIQATAGIIIQAKASIQKLAETTIQAKSSIKDTHLYNIESLARIKQNVLANILAKASIFIAGNFTSIISKASIKQENVTTTISAKGDIIYTSDEVITALGRITATDESSISSKASIKISDITNTLSALARIEILSEQTITAKANILNTQTKLINALGRVEVTSGKIIQAKANLKNTLEIISTSLGDIKKTETYLISALGRIELLTGVSIQAIGNILNTQDEVITSKARIETAGNSIVITAKANILVTSQYSISALSNLRVTTNKNILAKAAITQFGNAKQITAKAAILLTQETSVQSLARITILTENALLAKADIKKTNLNLVLAKASIFVANGAITVNAKARIEILSEVSISALANLRIPTSRSIQAKGSIIVYGTGKIISSKASIKNSDVTTVIISKADIRVRNNNKPILAKASVKKITTRTIGAKANIKITVSGKIIRAKASIKKLTARNIIAKASIKRYPSSTIRAKARIQLTISQTVTALSSIAIKDYLTLSAFKSETIIDISDYTDAKLQEYINRAQKMIDAWLGGNIGFSSYSDTDIRCMYDYPRSGLAIQLPRRPITSIRQIIVTFAPGETLTWNTSSQIANWRINEKVGYIEYFGLSLSEYALNICLRDPLASNITPMAQITYYAGYTVIPSDVTKATEILVEQLIRTEQGDDTDLTSLSIGNYRESYKKNIGVKGMGVIGGGDQVERLLRPYRQPSQTMFTYGPY